MKATRPPPASSAFSSGGSVRIFLLYGPDESGSRALMARLVRALGPDADRIDLTGAMLKDDPGLLAGEAASVSLFGGISYIVLPISGHDDPIPAIDILLSHERATNPVVIIAGGLKGTSPLVKRLLPEPAAMCFESYVPSERDLAEIAVALAREQGLRIDKETSIGLARLCGGDRAVLAREVEKLALFVDADPAAPQTASIAELDQISADNGESQLSDLNVAVFSGRAKDAARHISGLAEEGMEGIPLVRALSRRAIQLTRIKADLDSGKSPTQVMAPVFYKERDGVEAAARKWQYARLARAADRLLQAERDIKSSKSAGPILAEAEIIAIGRAAPK
jgi:DNA polymerase III subunit delta